MAINITKQPVEELNPVNIKMKPVTVGIIQKIQRMGLDKKILKGDMEAAREIAFILTDITEEDYEKLLGKDFAELFEFFTVELKEFVEDQKKTPVK
jgi:hypothetical protein